MNLMKENDIQYVLADQNIGYIREISIKKLHNRYYTTKDETLHGKRFDYYLPNLRTVIEFDGDQHFTPIDYFGGIEQFIKTVNTDFLKMNYCFSNNIKVIRLAVNTDSDLLVNALNDNKHNLITIKDNQIDKQIIDQFDLPESFNVYIENQALKLKIDQLEAERNQKEIDEMSEMTEIDDFINYVNNSYLNLFNVKLLPKGLLKAIYDDYQEVPVHAINRKSDVSFHSEFKPAGQTLNYNINAALAKYFNGAELLEMLFGIKNKDIDDIRFSEYLPKDSNVLNLLQSCADRRCRFRCYTKNK